MLMRNPVNLIVDGYVCDVWRRWWWQSPPRRHNWRRILPSRGCWRRCQQRELRRNMRWWAHESLRSTWKEMLIRYSRRGDSHLSQMLIPLSCTRCLERYERRLRHRRERILKRQTRRRWCIRALCCLRIKRRRIELLLSLHLLYLCQIYVRRLLRSRSGHILWHQRM